MFGFDEVEFFCWWIPKYLQAEGAPLNGKLHESISSGVEAAVWELAIQEGWRAVRSGSGGPWKGDGPSLQLAGDQQ